MRIFGFRSFTAIFLLFLISSDLWAQDTQEEVESALTTTSELIKVQGTELASLQSVMDVMRVLPGVSVSDENEETDVITVVGRGIPAIYLGNRKIRDISELRNITADRIQEIEILKHPGAEYDKTVEAVIIIRFKELEKEGFSLNNTLRLDMTHKLSPFDNLVIGWRRKALTIGGFVGWEEKRTETHKKTFTNRYENNVLISEKVSENSSSKTEKWIRAGVSAVYDFNIHNSLSFDYSFADRIVSDGLNYQNSQLTEHPMKRHDIALEFAGKFKGWNLSVGNNTTLNTSDQTVHKVAMESYETHRLYDVRTYAKASRSLWKGSLSLGVEYEMYDINVHKYDDGPSVNPDEVKYKNSHASHPDNTFGAFASVKQTFGKWTFEAGLRYEHYNCKYHPYDDDGLMLFLHDGSPEVQDLIKKSQAVSELINNGELLYRNGMFYPSLKISTQVGESELSLKHTEYCIPPDYAVTRLYLNEIDLWDQKILWAEIASSTTLGWNYKWVDLGVTFNHYDDPICQAQSGTSKYNAPDYDALNIDVTLSPKVGVWSPMLSASFQKQWFNMPLASGKDRLKQPAALITLNNTVTLPQNWIFRLNTKWHSRGANRNNYYFSSCLNIDASVQKSLPKQGLTFMLSCSNVLRNSYDDYGRYKFSSYGLSEGTRQRNLRVLSLTVQYKL